MHIHILGICGTFMGGVALIAKTLGFKVTGCDQNVYPPMSDELMAHGIEIQEGFDDKFLDQKPDLLVVGNVMKRGMPIVERMLNEKLPYLSGPEFLEKYCLKDKYLLSVAGTHGKTTTSAMLTWILQCNGKNPSFLIGGVLENFKLSARLTDSKYFCIEADEYDCAFFDKRSKFLHYHADVQILNNLEFDHADIFENLDAIKKQFHHLVRIIPQNGHIISFYDDKNINDVLNMGMWSVSHKIGDRDSLHAKLISKNGQKFEVYDKNTLLGTVDFVCTGDHNVKNALAAIKAAMCIGISAQDAISALSTFKLPKRRMELIGVKNGNYVYDDFAHHPTAIYTTIKGLRDSLGTDEQIIAIFEPRSNTMKMGANTEHLAQSFALADISYIYAPETIKWDVEKMAKNALSPLYVEHDFDKLLSTIKEQCKKKKSHVLIMSNGSFMDIHHKLLDIL